MRRLRDSLYRRYCSLLAARTHSQRLQQQKRHVTATPSADSGAQQRQNKTAFTKLQHDDLYLKDLPKTSYYQIFEVQKVLAQRGLLQTHSDVEDFYKSIQYNRHPSQIQRSLQDIQRKMLDKRPVTPDAEPEDSLNLRLAERGPESALIVSEEVFGGSLEKDEFDQMFPKMKIPTFLTLKPNFMRSFQSSLPHLTSLEVPKKSLKAEMYLKQIKDMHSLCLINMNFSQSFQLLDRKADSVCWLGRQNQKIPRLTLPDIDSHKESSQSAAVKQQLTVHWGPRPSARDGTSDPAVTKAQCLDSVVGDAAEFRSNTPEPLCMEDVYGQKNVKVIGCGLKFWKNYTVGSE